MTTTMQGTGSEHTSADTGNKNQRELLRWADRFGGWITSDLAAHIVWPQSTTTTARKSAEALIRRTVKSGLLIARKRPGGNNAGHVYTMTRAGAQTVQGRSAEDFGRIKNGKWQEPATFSHDLRTARFLIALRNQHHEIRTGDECLRRYATYNNDDVKVPDGLFRRTDLGGGAAWIWLETESENKNGQGMRALGRALYKIAAGQTRNYARDEAERGEAIQLGGVALLLPPSDRLDGRGRHADHRTRIRNAIRRAKADAGIWGDAQQIGLWIYSESSDDPWLWHKERDTLDLGVLGGDRTQHQGWISGDALQPEPNPEREEAEDFAAIIAGPVAGAEAMRTILDNISGRPARERGRLEFQRNDARRQARKLSAELDATRRRVRMLEARFGTVSKQLADAQTEAKAARFDADQANKRAATANQKVQAADAAIVNLRAKLADANNELERIRATRIGRFLTK